MFDCTMISRLKFTRRSFTRDTSGIAAVEFGLIAPVLLIMLVGVVEITRAVSIDRRFGQVTALVADLISREEVLKREDLDGVNSSGKRTGIYGIVEHVMGVWGVSTLKLHVYPVRASSDDRNNIYVYADITNRPSFGSAEDSPKNVCDPYTGLTTDLLDTRGTAIIVEGEFGYTPLLAERSCCSGSPIRMRQFRRRNNAATARLRTHTVLRIIELCIIRM
jgi:Flp pilus assembly pilin Flp